MQDVDRVLAEVAAHATAAGLDLESVREVLLANMLGERPLPTDFRGGPPPEPEAAPVRVIDFARACGPRLWLKHVGRRAFVDFAKVDFINARKICPAADLSPDGGREALTKTE